MHKKYDATNMSNQTLCFLFSTFPLFPSGVSSTQTIKNYAYINYLNQSKTI